MLKEGLIHKDESYYLVGLFYSVQNKLGPNQKERQYCDAVELLLKDGGKDFEREFEIKIPFGSGEIGGNRVDFLFERKILIDAKAKKYITKEDYRQMLRYLEASGLKLGIIVNFRGDKVVCKRVINRRAFK